MVKCAHLISRKSRNLLHTMQADADRDAIKAETAMHVQILPNSV